MSDRGALVDRITREVMARLHGRDEPVPPSPSEKPDRPDTEQFAYKSDSPYPAASSPADYGHPSRACFHHPDPADQEDRAGSVHPAQRAPETVRSFVAAGASRIGNSPGSHAVPRDIAGYIDHTLLKPDATQAEIERLCAEARDYGFASVCVNPSFVKLSARLLKGSGVEVCTVVGFPLGATTPAVKAFETRKAVREGAKEIDMVINVGALKSGNYDLVQKDIEAVVGAGHESGAVVKVIIEAALLSDEEKVAACVLAKRARADFVKTSTGFASGGATLRDVAIMRATVGPEMGVKAAGGIRSYLDALGMIEAGATRIGASAGVGIVQESRGKGAPSPPEKEER
jgi:deoxyribose-phosphate aldolase